MNLSDFDYDLPKELIAQYPLTERDSCRLMVLDRASGKIEHRRFRDFAEYFGEGDALVLNDSRVLNCRLIGTRTTGGKVEVFLLRLAEKKKSEIVFEAMISHSRVKPGEKIFFRNGIPGTISGKNLVSFPAKDEGDVYRLGQVPLPPYIKRAPEPLDEEYYQTVYSACPGSLAAPTAGLHFTGALLDEIRRRKTRELYLTLHVGTDTFKPVKVQDITRHQMHGERYIIPAETVTALSSADRPRICAVGTTVCRTLETWAQARAGASSCAGRWAPARVQARAGAASCAGAGAVEGESRLFIYPGYTFRVVDRLLTNFHLPKTTLFMLVCAFAGAQNARKAYAEAVAQAYRFYSYGDAMLII